MSKLSTLVKCTCASVLTGFLLASIASAQANPGAPRTEKLLNGMRVLMWTDRSSPTVEIRVRIHSGSAFDPQGKEGVMHLLADNIFPNEAARDYFGDDLGGTLAVFTGYDFIEVDATGRADAMLEMMQTVAAAVSNVQIDKDTTAKLKSALMIGAKKLEADPAYVADQAAGARLFGTFPYGRPIDGTPASIARIDFADLLDAKARFFTADNATVAITGNFDKDAAYRGVRRYFGGWLKADKRVPSTFRQPEAPPSGMLTLSSPSPDRAELRFIMRGTARGVQDFAAGRVLSAIVENRLRSHLPPGFAAVFVHDEEHFLPGAIVIGFSANHAPAANSVTEANSLVLKALADPITEAELDAGRSVFAAEWARKDPVSFWLDADTYGTDPAADVKAPSTVTMSDVNSFADRVKLEPIATVAITPVPAN